MIFSKREGGEHFIEGVSSRGDVNRKQLMTAQSKLPAIGLIVERVAKQFKVSEDSIYTASRGRGSANQPRWVSLYLCREISGHSLNEITEAFHMNHIAGVHHSVSKLKQEMNRSNLTIPRILFRS